ncbi:spike base protein, RCAP_Rcc01079 family [Agrobacterium tumefaciens]|uniref:spike base protein, RCAP_Rcc01079 family n=1 Tax=Agrobacterium tumefaciens TaxID=358 RepID=UPI0012D352F1|nr:hypothetical protein [Agrobacterium tumefaciens]
MPNDPFQTFMPTPSSPGVRSRIVTPSQSDLPKIVKGVICLTAGDIAIVPANDDGSTPLQFVDVPAGFMPPYRVRRVTAATAVVATIEG